MTVTARRVPDHQSLTQPGDFHFAGTGDTKRIIFRCPCGCGECLGVLIGPKQEPQVWQWDGNESSPTLTPSIHVQFGCRWHGFLTAGVFQSC